MKLYGAYARQDNIASSVQTNLFPGYPISIVAYDNNAWMLGVTAPLFGGNIRASYQASDGDNINTATYQFEPDYYVWGIGYDYPLSRRTNVYIDYGQREWDGTLTSTPIQANPSGSVPALLWHSGPPRAAFPFAYSNRRKQISRTAPALGGSSTPPRQMKARPVAFA